ncbi:MAG: formate dehydrogenase accessory sulfurtransferase FdhD [Burkholderiaceae bacterium]
MVAAIDETGKTVDTRIAGEHPLTLYLDKREIVTLMTLGAAPEALTIGYLRNQRLIDGIADLAAVQVDWDSASVAVTTRHRADTGETIWDADERQAGDGHADESAAEPTPGRAARLTRRTVTSGCGQGTMFGDLMDEVEAVRLPGHARLTEPVLYALMENVRRYDTIYKEAGAVHGCALAANAGPGRGDILVFVEDVGRHNAVDAIAGWMWLTGNAGDDKVFYTTGRLTSEMVIKCAQMGIPFLVSRSGLTEMGHRIAQRVGMTMLGRCRGRHYLLFTGAQRFVREPGGDTALA